MDVARAQDQTDIENGYVAGQVIVKFRPTLRASDARIIKDGRRFQDYLTDQSDSLDKLIKKLQVLKIEHLHSPGNDLLLFARREKRKARLRRNLKKRFAPFSVQQREEILSNLPDIDHIYLFHVHKEMDIEDIVDGFEKNPYVEYAQPNYIMQLSSFEPNDPFYESGDLWGLENIGEDGIGNNKMTQVWDEVQGEGMIVAVMDSGVDINHPDIADNIWTNPNEIPDNGIDDDSNLIDWTNPLVDDVVGWDFISHDNDPQDGNGHGTHVAGIIAAMGNNAEGGIGVAPKAKIMPVRVLNDDGHGSTSAMTKWIIYAAEQMADVINLSLGCTSSCPENPEAENAVLFAYELGSVIIFAAGNDKLDVKNFSPENMAEVITVAAIDSNNSISAFSNFGILVDVAVPGRNLISLNANGGDNTFANEHPEKVSSDVNYRWGTGTSFASPHVSGLVILILQHFPADGLMTLAQRVDFVKQKLIDTSLPVTGKEIGGGRVNAARAILGVPPEIEDFADITVDVGDEVTFTVTATDADDDNEDIVLSASLESGEGVETVGARL